MAQHAPQGAHAAPGAAASHAIAPEQHDSVHVHTPLPSVPSFVGSAGSEGSDVAFLTGAATHSARSLQGAVEKGASTAHVQSLTHEEGGAGGPRDGAGQTMHAHASQQFPLGTPGDQEAPAHSHGAGSSLAGWGQPKSVTVEYLAPIGSVSEQVPVTPGGVDTGLAPAPTATVSARGGTHVLDMDDSMDLSTAAQLGHSKGALKVSEDSTEAMQVPSSYPVDAYPDRACEAGDFPDQHSDSLEGADGADGDLPRALQWSDYCGCLVVGVGGLVAAGVLWSRYASGEDADDTALRWAIAATIVGAVCGYCVWLCIMSSKFERLQAEWVGQVAPPGGVVDGSSSPSAPSPSARARAVFDCAEDCRNPAWGTCKLLMLVVGGLLMTPLFIVPYLLGKGAIHGCRCCCQHVCVPCMEGCCDCLTGVFTRCLLPVWRGVVAAGVWVWTHLAVPAWENVVWPMLHGMWRTLVWIWRNVVVALARVLWDSVACLYRSLTAACTALYTHVLAPCMSAVRAACTALHVHILKPLGTTLAYMGRCVYEATLRPALHCLWSWVAVPLWRAVQWFYTVILQNMWLYLVVTPVRALHTAGRWVCGTCFPAIGRALHCLWMTVVYTPAMFLWRHALRPAWHCLCVVPARAVRTACTALYTHVLAPMWNGLYVYVLTPIWQAGAAVVRGISAACAAVAACFTAVAASVGSMFAGAGTALAGGARPADRADVV